MIRVRSLLVLVALLAAPLSPAQAYDKLVEKKSFTMPSYTTVGGKTIPDVKVGYETYGKLSPAGDNVIFIAHFYSGTSHAAGKYKESDAAPGYWDPIIGSGRAIDTDKYFVISADTLVNLNVKDPNVVTTGPASIDPATGKPYGMSFPVVSMRDSVRVHKALVDSLGVKKLQAVAGASGGAIQAMEWAALYPDFVKRVIHVVGPGFSVSPWVVGLLDAWATPVKLDPRWNGGDYYGKEEPVAGVAASLKLVTLTARYWGWAEKTFDHKWADAQKNPANAYDNLFQIEDVLQKAGMARAKNADGNHVIYMSKANQLFDVEAEVPHIKAKVLFIPSRSDLIFPPEASQKAAAKLKALGHQAQVFVLEGDGGHLEGVLDIVKAAAPIKAFLAK
jgi:homoserine O-acetyltransferase/O-succinyltransferase